MDTYEKKKLCVIFPGIGYTIDKPLLYYIRKIMQKDGYEIMSVTFSNLSKNIKGSKEKMHEAFENALSQAREQLENTDWESYEDIVFVGKSIGTAVSAAYGSEIDTQDTDVRYIYLTPLVETYNFMKPSSGIAFHGTADPWADTDEVTELSQKKNIPLHTYEGANHSLETGDTLHDIKILSDVISLLSSPQ